MYSWGGQVASGFQRPFLDDTPGPTTAGDDRPGDAGADQQQRPISRKRLRAISATGVWRA